MTHFIRTSGNQFFIRYANNTAWVYDNQGALSQCVSCCPYTFISMWEDFNTVCNDKRVTHPVDLTSPYFTIQQETPPSGAQLSFLCGSPPQANLSSRIQIQIPYDPIFSGIYIFDYKSNTSEWKLNTTLSKINLSTYGDSYSTRYNKTLVSLAETSGVPTYKGYTEVAKSGNPTPNISGVFAFPAAFVFSAIQPPSDVEGYAINSPTNNLPFPATTGHRAVLGFQLPIRWRWAYSDWIIADAGGHKVSGSKYAKGWENGQNPNWIPSISLSVSGYATSMSGANTIGLSGITNIPATYNLSDSVTAITGSCTGLAHMGFCYKTSASGLPFDNSTYGIDIGSFTGIRQYFNKYDITYNSSQYSLDETSLFKNKQDMEAWITFSFSCRPSGGLCNDFNSINPVSTGYTTINGTCVGSYINVDYACGENVSRPTGDYFTGDSITNIKIVYSGLPQNVYPFVELPNNSSSGNVYKAGSSQMIYVDYDGVADPNSFREWINNRFNFVELDNGNNIIRKWPGVDLYWWKPVSPANTVWARLIPSDSAPFESNCAGIYIIEINNISLWETSGQPCEEFLGQYAHDSENNRFINITSDSLIQIRFIVDKWHLGKVINNNFESFYTLQYTTGGVPQLLNPQFVDYSDYVATNLTWNKVKIPMTCNTNPVGQWINTNLGTGVAISIKDPIPTSYNENNTCC